MPIAPIVIYSLGFLLIALAAKQIGKFFSQYGLPYITGYLLAGALAGPFLLGLLPKDASETLRYIDDISLAVIAFIAGSELYLKELKSRMRGILLNTTGIVVVAFILISVALFFLQSFIPFTEGYNFVTTAAVAMLGATILLALSPASTIAVIQEVRAKGPFSKTVLSIAVVMDVVIIVFFAVAVAFAGAMIDGDPVTMSFLLILVLDIIIALVVGYIVGRGIGVLLSTPVPPLGKMAVLLALGFVLFESANYVPDWVYGVVGIKIKIEPLLMSMVAGFTVTNYTRYRQPFEDLLHDISPWVYVAFFTLTGVGLKLDILLSTIGIAAILFAVRAVSIVIGSYLGGIIAGEEKAFRRFAGLGLITQAGIALGLARETAVFFPDTLGGEFATLIISVVVLNEIFGPMLLKFALRQVGEAYIPGDESNRRLVIMGMELQSIALARQMIARGWNTVIVDTDKKLLDSFDAQDIEVQHIDDVTVEALEPLFTIEHDALVAMMDDDATNLRACEIARVDFDLNSVVARVRDVSWRDSFMELGVRMIDPASAMVNLLDQSINAPEAVDLLLHQDPDHDIAQVMVGEKAIDGLPLRDLRLPADVLILEILRDGMVIVPHGFSKLRMNDAVTILGSPDSLAEVTLKLS